MRKIYTKIPAIVAMIACIAGFALITTLTIAFLINDDFANPGFGVGIIICATAIISYFFYFIDAILLIVKAVLKIHPVFNGILAFLIVGTIPMTLWTLNAKQLYIGLLCAYYLAIFVLEVISVVKHIKIMRDCKNNKEN